MIRLYESRSEHRRSAVKTPDSGKLSVIAKRVCLSYAKITAESKNNVKEDIHVSINEKNTTGNFQRRK